jgi:YidC/Oxa1 family membrane protein insertase
MSPFDVFIPILINPLINVLLVFYHLAQAVGLPGPLGWAIVLLTISINLVVYPLKSAQLRSQKKMTELRPHLAELKRVHGHDPARHREEQAKLFKERGYNPAAGCLPLLIQLPVLIGLYNVFFQTLQQKAALDHLNNAAYSASLKLTTLDLSFFGLSLATIPSQQGFNTPLILLPIVTGALQLILARMTAPAAAPPSSKEASFEDALASTQGSMLYIFPVMTAYFAYILPVGLALYWNVTTVFAIIQQYLIAGPGGLSSWLPKRKTP